MSNSLNIALDFDGTITEDPNLWYYFCQMSKSRGHKVYIVTMRYPEEEVKQDIQEMIHRDFISVVEDVIYTYRRGKQEFVDELGIRIDIWIDDNPKAVYMHASEAFGQSFSKGSTTHTLKGKQNVE